MNWKQTAVEYFTEILRVAGWAFLLVDAILLAIFSLWFVWRFLWHLQAWLTKTLFSKPW